MSALQINGRFGLRRFDDGAFHAMLIELEFQCAIDAEAIVKLFHHRHPCYTTIACNAHASRFSIRLSTGELWRLCGRPRPICWGISARRCLPAALTRLK